MGSTASSLKHSINQYSRGTSSPFSEFLWSLRFTDKQYRTLASKPTVCRSFFDGEPTEKPGLIGQYPACPIPFSLLQQQHDAELKNASFFLIVLDSSHHHDRLAE